MNNPAQEAAKQALMASLAAQPKGPAPKTDIKTQLGESALGALKAFAAMEGTIPEASQPVPAAMQRSSPSTSYGFGDPFNEEALIAELRGSVTEIPEKTVCPYCQGPAALVGDAGGYQCENCGREFSMDADGAPQDVDVAANSSVGPESSAAPNLRTPQAGGVYRGDLRGPQRNYEASYTEDDDPNMEDSEDGPLAEDVTTRTCSETQEYFNYRESCGDDEEPLEDLTKSEAKKPASKPSSPSPTSPGSKKQLDHYIYVPHHKVSATIAALNKKGIRSSVTRTKGDSHTMIVAHHNVAKSEHGDSKDFVRKVAKKVGGTYDGWGSNTRVRESVEDELEESLQEVWWNPTVPAPYGAYGAALAAGVATAVRQHRKANKRNNDPSARKPPQNKKESFSSLIESRLSEISVDANRFDTKDSALIAAQNAAQLTGVRHWVMSEGSKYSVERNDKKQFGGMPVAAVDSKSTVRESQHQVFANFSGRPVLLYEGDDDNLANNSYEMFVNKGRSVSHLVNGSLARSYHPGNESKVAFAALVEAKLPEAWTAANSLGVLGGALGLGGVAGYFAGRKGGKEAADTELELLQGKSGKRDMPIEKLPPWDDDYWHPKKESIEFGKRILERLSKFDEDLTTANVGTGPDVALGSNIGSDLDVSIEIRKDPDKTFSIVAKYGDGTSTDLESNIQTKEEAATLLADYQEQYGSGEDYKTEQTMRQPSTKSLIESIARGGTLDEKSLRLYLEDEDFGKILATPDATTKYDINPAEKPEKGEAEPWLTSSGMEPKDGGGASQDDPQGTLPEEDPPVNSGPTKDPFTAAVAGAGDNSPEDAQFMEQVRRQFAPHIKERIDSLFEEDDDDKPAFLKKKGKDDDSDDDDDDDDDDGDKDKKKDDDKKDDKDKKEALRRFQGALTETLNLLPRQFRESISKKHYSHISHILKTSATKDELHHRLADMMAMDNPRFDKDRFHQAAGTTGYELPPGKPKKKAVENKFNLNSGAGLRAQMIVGLQEQKADPIFVHEAMSSQFSRALSAFEEALDPIQSATTPQTSLTPADHDSVNPGATPQEDVPSNAVPEKANNANPPMKETQRPVRRSPQEGRFLRARYGRGLNEEGDPLGGAATIDPENDNPNNEEMPSDSGEFYTASPEASAATQAAQDLNAPAPEVDSLENLEGGTDDTDQVSFNVPATQESVIELVRSGMINYMSEDYQRLARKLAKEGVITEADWAGTAGKVGTAALNVAKTGVDLGGRLASRAARALPAGARPALAGAAVGATAGYLARRHQDQQDESIISEESFEDFLAPLGDDERLIKKKIESKLTESDFDKQLQQGTLVYANGVEGVPNGTQGQVIVQMPSSAGFLYMVKFAEDSKLVRQDQLTV